MERKTKKRIKKALKIVSKTIVVVLYFVAMFKFFNVDEICEKMEYGMTVFVLTVLFFSKDGGN